MAAVGTAVRPWRLSPPVTDLSVRPVRRDERDAVWRLHEAAMRASPLPFVPDVNRDLRGVPGSYDDGAFLVGTVPAGTDTDPGDRSREAPEVEGAASPEAPTGRRLVACGGFLPADPATVELARLRVHPDHRRRGYGSALVRALERAAGERGFERATLETAARLEAARALYRSLGYERVGSHTHPEANIELVRFERALA